MDADKTHIRASGVRFIENARSRLPPVPKDSIFHNLFQGKTDSFLGHEAAVQVSGSPSLRKNKELVHFKLDNDKRWCKKRKKSMTLCLRHKINHFNMIKKIFLFLFLIWKKK